MNFFDYLIVEGLNTYRKSVHASLADSPQVVGTQVARIGFKGNLSGLRSVNGSQHARYLFRREQRGCPPSEIDSRDGVWS